MFFFEGSSCPVCEKPFGEKDDIVVCPECGTPHHRECYRQTGRCVNAAKHAEGFSWKKRDAAGTEGMTCPECGKENPVGRMFCQACGWSLSKDAGFDPDYAGSRPNTADSGDSYRVSGGEVVTIHDGELIEDVPVGDIKRFVGNMWYFYVPLFLDFFRKRRKVSFSLSACLLHGIWFISRKMYVVGGLLLSFMLGMTGLRVYYSSLLLPAYEKYLEGDMSGMTDFIMRKPMAAAALVIGTTVQYLIYLLSGLFANRLYMNHCIKSIKRINAEAGSADRFNEMLESRGGTAMMLSLIVAMVYFGVQYYLTTLM